MGRAGTPATASFPQMRADSGQASLVNTGTADAHLNVNGYGADGTLLSGSPMATTVAAGKQILSSVNSFGFGTAGAARSGWVQAPADVSSLTGLVTIGNGTLFDALPLSAGRASTSVLTDIELDDTYSTEIHVVNTATNRRSLNINLSTGNFTYTPTVLNFNGVDSFTYQASDGASLSNNVATVTLNIAAVNDAPVANNDGVFNVFNNATLHGYFTKFIAHGILATTGGGGGGGGTPSSSFGVTSIQLIE